MLELITLKNIHVSFSGRSILSNISFSLLSNRIITLIGPNGAGKSTLIRVILGLIQPNLGNIIRSPKISVGYVPQKLYFNNLLPITVEKFMKLSKRKKNINILKILKRVKAQSLQYSRLQNLSGGEMQRILLARALLNNPNLLVLDEPTQGVDVMGQLDLYELINQIRSEMQCSILIVSHDLNFVMAKTNYVICLNKHICCSGTPQTVFKNLEFISIFGLKHIRELAIYQHNHDHVHQY
ncbi:zinc ABC transporter ATP-binding protein ZnuC [Buchnera aphidicola]|jgi:zinc transport system ATP-binding protein|uniref:Zinc import ATP-binding protein ZnuC n=1 Tax=Buchnera aphidicola subsp. Schizaphis graminum (strain Sg) TaxID=198804 RepID=ZNUC_BUCAP|nr:zinc ABC transporter ATP-binding protein ZnuC [Buchnera aphidicola]Q8K9M6.1 RecName: Full=Zinc import ATP-binding protein ZnuC [Buchnera aphidicola str. Sg (Schizaphis graminum)]AAM67862.1 high-affinity zinc uptake system ATP-binding protein [Buchnera aphidicola str. Sg (Schizaphis graminum)]AWI49642.1 zinc ABC transporter ATP-binding protein ZnuC [Buchnera aphidicola (Schizaphis graminum)]